jgi:hypothetical protein
MARSISATLGMPTPPHIGISNLFTPEKVKNIIFFYKKQQFNHSGRLNLKEMEDPFDSKSAENWKV